MTHSSILESAICLAALLPATGHAAESWTGCAPAEVTTYVSRLHVRCAASVAGISYFAVGTQDAPFASRVLAVLTAAQVAGRALTILYDPADLGGASIGCATSNCRLIRAVGFGP